jgi:hypothetical protein
LDQTILSISRLFQVGNRDESYRFSKLEHAISARDARVCAENHFLTGESKESYIYSKPQFIYELRNVARGTLLEMMYWSKAKPDDGSFLRSGCTPSDDSGRSFKLSFAQAENGA